MYGYREGRYFRDRNGCLRKLNHRVKWYVPLVWYFKEFFGHKDTHAYTLDEHIQNLDIKKTNRQRGRIKKKAVKKANRNASKVFKKYKRERRKQ